jgi:hypothetical protein
VPSLPYATSTEDLLGSNAPQGHLAPHSLVSLLDSERDRFSNCGPNSLGIASTQELMGIQFVERARASSGVVLSTRSMMRFLRSGSHKFMLGSWETTFPMKTALASEKVSQTAPSRHMQPMSDCVANIKSACRCSKGSTIRPSDEGANYQKRSDCPYRNP